MRPSATRRGLRARRLVDVSTVDQTVRMFGQSWASPVALCPLSAQRAFHPDGEVGSARAAKARLTEANERVNAMRQRTRGAGAPR